MPRFKFAKLVRDKIVEHQIASGAEPKYRLLSEEEHRKELINKIIEEAGEITDSNPEDRASEIADVQQAVDDLVEKYGLTREQVSKEQARKNAKNGAFKKGIYVEYVEAEESGEWTEYYRRNQGRYPEID